MDLFRKGKLISQVDVNKITRKGDLHFTVGLSTTKTNKID